jgi:hypothetical protein
MRDVSTDGGERLGVLISGLQRLIRLAGAWVAEIRSLHRLLAAWVTILAATLTVLSFAPSGSAGTSVITFDEPALAAGTPIDRQYAAKGIVFAPSDPVTGKTGGTLPAILSSPQAVSPPNVGSLSACAPEFPCPWTFGRLSKGSRAVKVWIGNYDLLPATVLLAGYAGDGTPVGEASAMVGPGSKAVVSLTTSRDIWSIMVGSAFMHPRNIFIDDLSFDVPDGPAVPTFGIRRDGPADLPVYLTRGNSAHVPMRLSRSPNSIGRIEFGRAAPSGVTATVEPPITAAGDGTSLDLVLAAGMGAACGDASMTVTARALDPTAGDATVRTMSVPLVIRCPVVAKLRVTGIEVTQGVQYDYAVDGIDMGVLADRSGLGLPQRDHEASAKPVQYYGVHLVQGRLTYVRVFANTADGPAIDGVTATLTARRANGTALGPSPLLPVNGPRDLRPGGPNGDHTDRISASGAYVFMLPLAWTKVGPITLIAEVHHPVTPGFTLDPPLTPCETTACRASSVLALGAIDFHPVYDIDIKWVDMNVAGVKSPSDPFAAIPAVFPFSEDGLWVDEHHWLIDITDLIAKIGTAGPYGFGAYDDKDAASDAIDRLIDRDDENRYGGTMLVGVDPTSKLRGQTRPACGGAGGGAFEDVGDFLGLYNCADKAVMSVPAGIPLRGVAHEIGHGLSLQHASYCGGGGDDGQSASTWPPDEQGLIQGVGFDRRPTGSVDAPFAIIASDPASGVKAFDFMSYCANANSWLSTRNWETLMDLYRTDCSPTKLTAPFCPEDAAGSRSSSRGGSESPRSPSRGYRKMASAEKPTLEVVAIVRAGAGLRIASVTRRAAPRRRPAPASAYRVVLRDIAGRVVADVPMSETSLADAGLPTSLVRGNIPALPAGATVQIVLRGRVLASRSRSRSAPRVRLTTPARETLRSRRVTVRWRANDSDGDSLSARLDYSPNGGRSWRPLFLGPNRGSVRIPAGLLGASNAGRLRVTVSDGFRDAVAVSRLFRAVGAPPLAKVSSPLRGSQLMADAALVFAGQARDDLGRTLKGRRLCWFAGHRRLGCARALTVLGLPPSTRQIRLEARDRIGRVTSVRVPVRVRAAVPRILALRVPTTASRRATRVSLHIAASLPATLVIRSRRFAVDRRPRKITIRISRSIAPLRLRLLLTSDGRSSTTGVTIRRTR